MVIVQRVVYGLAFPAETHQLGVLQHPELMADRRLAHLHCGGDILHTKFGVVQSIEDLDPGRVSKTRNRSAKAYSTSSSGTVPSGAGADAPAA